MNHQRLANVMDGGYSGEEKQGVSSQTRLDIAEAVEVLQGYFELRLEGGLTQAAATYLAKRILGLAETEGCRSL